MNQMDVRSISSKAKQYCPISSAAEVMADHWSVIILRDIAICNQRTFGSILANNNENISTGTLANRLKRMSDLGLLTVIKDPAHSQRKIYCLSSKAIELIPILIDMSIWALKHASPSPESNLVPRDMESSPSTYAKNLVEQLQSTHLFPAEDQKNNGADA
ncbi:helix-turn-helix transcriptional regulator [Alphaproteobacteria bacterium]|jgi:DNA-binding HxlR family transcriptional regulator|nr:helix-turn-helix transcriptional regulator [Alphaproteobacteria bacterium]